MDIEEDFIQDTYIASKNVSKPIINLQEDLQNQAKNLTQFQTAKQIMAEAERIMKEEVGSDPE